MPLYRRVLETGEPVVHTESTDDDALQMGERRHWLSSYYPVHTPDGEVIGVGAVIMEITDRKRADDRLRLLAEAGELFSTSLDQDEIASRIAQVGVPRLADTCNVYLVRDGRRSPASRASPPIRRRSRCSSRCPTQLRARGRVGAASQACSTASEPLLLRTIPDEYLDELERFGADRRGVRADRHALADVRADRRPRRDPRHPHARLAAVPTASTSTTSTSPRSSRGRAGVAMDNARLVGELRRRAQAAQALEFVGDGVFLVDGDGVVRLWNPAAARITGLAEARWSARRAETVLAGWPLGQGERAADLPGRRASAASSGSR